MKAMNGKLQYIISILVKGVLFVIEKIGVEKVRITPGGSSCESLIFLITLQLSTSHDGLSHPIHLFVKQYSSNNEEPE